VIRPPFLLVPHLSPGGSPLLVTPFPHRSSGMSYTERRRVDAVRKRLADALAGSPLPAAPAGIGNRPDDLPVLRRARVQFARVHLCGLVTVDTPNGCLHGL
jgi:hypothetical protein